MLKNRKEYVYYFQINLIHNREDPVMTDAEWTHRILEHRTAINDTFAFTHSEGPNSCYDPDRGVFYTVCTASRRCYGEANDLITLLITPVCQPHRSITKVVAERGVPPIRDEGRVLLINPNCFYYQTGEVLYHVGTHFGQSADIYRGFVRITFSILGKSSYYTDYDIIHDRFSEIKPLMIRFHGKETHFTGDVYKTYLAEHGFTDFNSEEKGEELIISDKFRLQEDGYRYALVTAAWAWPAMVRLKDGEDVLEFVGVIPQAAQYEAQSAFTNGKYYAVLRGAKTDDFYISDDLGKTWHPAGRIDFNTTRPQILPYKGKILIGVSKKGLLPNKVRDGRNNLLLLYGDGEDLAQYKTIFHVTDPLGMVYYDIQNYKDELYMFWSSASLFVNRNPQAKDLIWYAHLGELD